MPTSTRAAAVAVSKVPTVQPFEYEQVLAKLSPKDRAAGEKLVALREIEPADGPRHAALWRRLVGSLFALSPFAAKFAGPKAMQFFVQDGKYRMQSFALDDSTDGQLTVYCSDVLDEAIAAGVLRPDDGLPNEYHVSRDPHEHLFVERVSPKGAELPALFKGMMGWNRKALRIAIPLSATDARVAAAEAVCAVSMAKLPSALAAPAAGHG